MILKTCSDALSNLLIEFVRMKIGLVFIVQTKWNIDNREKIQAKKIFICDLICMETSNLWKPNWMLCIV